MISARSSLKNGGEAAGRRSGAVVAAVDPLVSEPFRPSLVLTFRGHRAGVRAAGFQPSLLGPAVQAGGETPFLFSCGADGLVFLWSVKPTVRTLRFVGHRGTVHDCAWSPHAHLIASAGHDGFLRLWLPSLRRSGGLAAPSTSSNTSENYCHWRAHGGPVRSLAIAPHDDYLYTAGDDKSVKCWDLNYASSAAGSRSVGNKFVCGFTGGHQNWVRSVAVSGGGGGVNNNDGGLLPTHISLVASGGDDRTVQVWDTRSRTPTHTFYEHTASVRSVQFHPDGCSIATGSADHTINVFDLRRNCLLQHYDAHDGCVNEVRFAPTGSWLLSASADGAVKLWDLKEGYLYCALNAHEGSVHTARFSDDGSCFTTAGDDGIVMMWRSGLPRVVPPYATYPNTHLNPSGNTQTRLQMSREPIEDRATPTGAGATTRETPPPPPSAPTREVPSQSIPMPESSGSYSHATRGGIAVPALNEAYCSIDTSQNHSSENNPPKLSKLRETDTVTRPQGRHTSMSILNSQFSSPSSSRKPPLPQPYSRSAATPAAALASSFPPSYLNGDDRDNDNDGNGNNSKTRGNEVSNIDWGNNPKEVQESKIHESLQAFTRQDEMEERSFSNTSYSPTVEKQKGEKTKVNVGRTSDEKVGKQNQNIQSSALASTEPLKEHSGEVGCVQSSEIDDEISVVEYVGNTCDDRDDEEAYTNGSTHPPLPCHEASSISHRRQERQRADDRLRYLEEACARLTIEVQLLNERNAVLMHELPKQWEAQQRKQRTEIDQLRQMMEGLVAQQGALLQALRKE